MTGPGNPNFSGTKHLGLVAENLELCNQMWRSLLPEAAAMMRGEKPWSPAQARVFCALMDRAAPAMSVSFAHIRHSSDNAKTLTVEELEAIASGQSPERGLDHDANPLIPNGNAEWLEPAVTAQPEIHDARLNDAPDARTHDAQAPTPLPPHADGGAGGVAPPLARRDVLPPRPPDSSQHSQNVPTPAELLAVIRENAGKVAPTLPLIHHPHVPRGSRDPRLIPDPDGGPPLRFKILLPDGRLCYARDLRDFAITRGLDPKRMQALATIHARNPSCAPQAHKGYVPVDTECP